MYNLLKITKFKSFFIFDGKFYEHCDVVAIDSPLGPTLGNVFIFHFENIWLEDFPPYFKPVTYRKFWDDRFLLFWSKYHVEKFKNHLNKRHENIKLALKIERNGLLSFLHIIFSRGHIKDKLKDFGRFEKQAAKVYEGTYFDI